MKNISISLILALLMVGCSSDNSSSIIKEGVAVDGYLKGSTICIDLNGNSICDEGEPSTVTEDNGEYKLDYSGNLPRNSSILLYGGIDTSTNKSFEGLLRAPVEYQNITPLTTLVEYQKRGSKTLEEAEAEVARLINIEPDKLNLDPISEAKVDKRLLKATLKIQKLLDVVVSIDGDSKRDLRKIDRLLSRVAKIASNTNSFVDALVESTDRDNKDKEILKSNLETLESVIDKKVDESNSIDEAQKVVEIAKDRVEEDTKKGIVVDEATIEESINNYIEVKESNQDSQDNNLELNSSISTDNQETTNSSPNPDSNSSDNQLLEENTTVATDENMVTEDNNSNTINSIDSSSESLSDNDNRENINSENIDKNNTHQENLKEDINTTQDEENENSSYIEDINHTDISNGKIDNSEDEDNRSLIENQNQQNQQDKNTTNSNIDNSGDREKSQEENRESETIRDKDNKNENSSEPNQGEDANRTNNPNEDNVAPEIILNGESEVELILGDTYEELGAKAIDNVDGEVNVTISGTVDDKNLGEYQVEYSAVDSSGNEAKEVRVVKVVSPRVLVENLDISEEACDSWREIKVYPYKSEYFYTLNNNDWGRSYLNENSTGIQCIFKIDRESNEAGGWYWGWPDNNDYQVKGYPEAIYGAKFKSIKNEDSGFPALVSDIQSVVVKSGYRDIGITKRYNIALEFWLHTDKETSMDNIEYEIMFRFDPNGFHPTETKIGELELGGMVYDVYKNASYDPNEVKRIFINFVAKEKVTNFVIDFKKALDYLTAVEFSDIPQRYMSGIEMGVEMISGRGAVILEQLDVDLKLNSSIANLSVGDEYEKRYIGSGKYELQNAPKGMRILNGGVLTWTPTKSQVGDYSVTVLKDGSEIDTLQLTVQDKEIVVNGYFIDPTLKDNGDGSEEHPFNGVKEACRVAKAGDNLYIRGGVYKSADYGEFIQRPARFLNVSGCIGEVGKPITLRPWGNEFVKLQGNGLNIIKVKNGSKYVIIERFEIEGIAQDLNQSIVASQWWAESDYIKGGGISIGADYITVRDCVVHDMPGVGISANKSRYTTIDGNVVYNCDWWTIAGSNGIGITTAYEDDENPSDGKFYNRITNNFIFNVEQRIFSRVWKKGFANLTIDEGEAFLIQDNGASYRGRYLIENNLLLFNGKSGVINSSKNVTIKNNSYYANGTNTRQAGFRINSSPNIELFNNAIDAPLDKTAYSVGGDYTPIARENYVYGSNQDSFIEGITKVETPIFNDPQNLDFTIRANMPQDIGVDRETLEKFNRVVKDYAIDVTPTNYVVDRPLLTQQIIDSMPEGTEVVGFDDSDDKTAKLYLILPETHTATQLRGDANFTLLIPKENLDGVEIPQN